MHTRHTHVYHTHSPPRPTHTHVRTRCLQGSPSRESDACGEGEGMQKSQQVSSAYNVRRLPGRRSPPSRGLCAPAEQGRTSELNFARASCSRMATGHVRKSRTVHVLSPRVPLPTQGRDVTPRLRRQPFHCCARQCPFLHLKKPPRHTPNTKALVIYAPTECGVQCWAPFCLQ